MTASGSAGAATQKSKVVRLVKREGELTATLTYRTAPPKMPSYYISATTLRVARRGHVVLSRRLCNRAAIIDKGCGDFALPAGPMLSVRRVGAAGKRGFVVNLWQGGNTCCEQTFIAGLSPRAMWITRTWSFGQYRGERQHGRYEFISQDGRFTDAFTFPAGSTDPIQIWTLSRASRFVDITRREPRLVRLDAHRLKRSLHPWHHEAPEGALAAWCADQYLLGHGARCSATLSYDLRHGYFRDRDGNAYGRNYVRVLNRDLTQWGYEPRQ